MSTVAFSDALVPARTAATPSWSTSVASAPFSTVVSTSWTCCPKTVGRVVFAFPASSVAVASMVCCP
jgi:hypothetical protein